MTIMFADAALPNLRSACLLPVGDLFSKLCMMCREILGTVVTLPINVSIAAAARAHSAGGAATLVKYMDAVARFYQRLGAG